MPSQRSGFLLAGGDADFNNRQKQLFNTLNNVEKCLHKDPNVFKSNLLRKQVLTPRRRNRKGGRPNTQEVNRFRGQDSIFKQHNNVAPRNHHHKGIPDYYKNPSKWIKYSLEDTPNMTHTSNSQVAFAFLNQLINRKGHEEKDEEMEVTEIFEEASSPLRNKETERVIFKKKLSPVKGEAVIVDREETIMYRNTKLIMPECIVGKKPKNISKKKVKNMVVNNNNKYIKLGHLEESDEGE